MKCDKCGYDDNGSGDTAHACTFYQSLSQPVETPQRTWVGLDDEEMKKVWYAMQNIMGWYSFQEIAYAIEAKLKEKNT